MSAPEQQPAQAADPNATPPAQVEPKNDAPDAPAKPETDWRAEAKKWESRAKENKSAADRLTAIEDAQKTELQRAQERAESAERRAQELETKQRVADWKSQIAKEVGVPASALRGTTEEDLRAHAEELKQLLPDPSARNNGNGAFVPAEGRDTGNGGSDPRAQFGSIIQTLRGKS